MQQDLNKHQVSWLKRICNSPANADRPEFRKIYHLTLDGVVHTFAVSRHYFVCIAGQTDGSEISPANISDKISDLLRDRRPGIIVKVRALRGWAGSPDWDNKHLGCTVCTGEPVLECNYCGHGLTMRACGHCGQTHPCSCKECDGKGNLLCEKIQCLGWINSIILSRQLVAQAISGITVGEVTITDGAMSDPVYFDKDGVRAIVMPINQDQVTEEEIKAADRFQFGRKK